jgi:hypothetical protein
MGLVTIAPVTGMRSTVFWKPRTDASLALRSSPLGRFGPKTSAVSSTLQSRVPQRFHHGVVLYTGDEVLSFGAGLTAQPISSLWA